MRTSVLARSRYASTRGDSLVLVTRHEVAVQVEGRLDRRVAEVRRDRLRVDSGRDEEACERVPTLVQAD